MSNFNPKLLLFFVILFTISCVSATVQISPLLNISSNNNTMVMIINDTFSLTQLATADTNITYNYATIGFNQTPYLVTLTPVNFSNHTFYASVNVSEANLTLLTGGITGNYVVVNGTQVTSIAYQNLINLIAQTNNLSLIQSAVFMNGNYNITLYSTPVIMYITTLGSTATSDIQLYNNENQQISNFTNLYGERGRQIYFNLNNVDNGVNTLSDLEANIYVINASGQLQFNSTQNVTSSVLQFPDFVINDYSLNNYTLTLTDTRTGFSTTYVGSIQTTNIVPTITQLIAVTNGQLGQCTTGSNCQVRLTVNDDSCNLTGQTGYATFTQQNGTILFNSSVWSYGGESSKNFCYFYSNAFTPAFVDVINVSVQYTDVLNYSAFINGTASIGSPLPTGGSGGSYFLPNGTMYEALPGIVASLNKTTQFYNVFKESVAAPSPVQVIISKIADFFDFTVMTYTTQHCLQFAQSDTKYCENYEIQKIKLWYILLALIVIAVLIAFTSRVVLDYRRLKRYDENSKRKISRK